MDLSTDSDSDIEFIDNLRTPKARKIALRISFLETLEDNEFLKRFRVSKETFAFLLNKIETRLSSTTDRSHAIPASTKLYAALRFYATGTFNIITDDTIAKKLIESIPIHLY